MAIKLDSRQTVSRDSLLQLSNSSPTELDNLLRALNAEVTPPFRMRVTSGTQITMDGPTTQNTETLRSSSMTPINNVIPSITTLPVVITIGSGTITDNNGSTTLNFTISSNYYLKIGVHLQIDGKFAYTAGTQGTSIALATVPPVPANTYPIGYFWLFSNAGVIDPITNTNIFQYKAGGGSGGSGTGEINYIASNPDAEGSVIGWHTYADAAGTIPVDGTGGTATGVTLTSAADSGYIIRGTKSFKFSKAIGNQQGKGVNFGDVATDKFKIDLADQNKVLKIEFDYKTSGLYASGDVAVYIYDVDNSILITPSQTALVASSSNVAKFSATFISTNATYYRLIFHITTASNVWAFDTYFDNVIVGPGNVAIAEGNKNWSSLGTIGTNKVYGGTTVGSMTYTTSSVVVEEKGASATFAVNGVLNTVTTAPTGSLYFDLPSGYTINTTDMPAGTPIGTCTIWDATAGLGYRFDVQTNSTTSRVYLGEIPITLATTDEIRFTFKASINELASKASTFVVNPSIEYLANSGSSTSADDLTAFAYPIIGQAMVVFSSAGNRVKRRVRAINPVQENDTWLLQVKNTNSKWLPAEMIFPYMEVGSSKYGMMMLDASGSTPDASRDIDVVFGGDGSDASGTAWSASWSWRVIKTNTAVALGFGFADTGKSGLVSASAQNISGSKTFLGGAAIAGRTDGVAPSAGYVGEDLSTSAWNFTNFSHTANVWVDIASKTVNRGVYLVGVNLCYANNSGIGAININVGLGDTSGNVTPNIHGGDMINQNYPGTAFYRQQCHVSPIVCTVIADSTTIYVKFATYVTSSTAYSAGKLTIVRIA